MSIITIKLNDNFNIHTINNEIKYAFNNNENVIFIFDIVSLGILNWSLLLSILPLLKRYKKEIKLKLVKSIIVAPHKWQHSLLKTFFSLYKPTKPFQLVFNYQSIKENDIYPLPHIEENYNELHV